MYECQMLKIAQYIECEKAAISKVKFRVRNGKVIMIRLFDVLISQRGKIF